MDSTEFDLRAVLGVIRRQIRLILLVVVGVMALSSVVILSLKPEYTAAALVLVDTRQKNLLDPTAEAYGNSDSARVDSEVELAKAETVLLRAVRDGQLLDNPDFLPQPGLMSQILGLLRLRETRDMTGAEALESTMSKLRSLVTVQRRGLTFLIAVQARSGDPETAADLANAVTEAYIGEQLEAKIDSTLVYRDTIEARVTTALAAVASSEDAVDQFIGSNIDAIALETGRSDLVDTSRAIAEGAQQRAALASLVGNADVLLLNKDWDALVASLEIDALSALEAGRRAKAIEADAAVPGTPAEIDLRAELAAIEDQLTAEAATAVSGLRGDLATAQAKSADLETSLRASVLTSNLSSSTLTRIYELQQTADIARNQYGTLLTRLSDLDQQAFLQVADSRIVSEALPPGTPSFPRPSLLLSLAGLVALALGVGLAFLYENFIGGVTSTDQLQALTRARRALVVPRQKEAKSSFSRADTIVTAPLSFFSESIRKVRAAVEQAIVRRGRTRNDGEAKRQAGVILVTSAAPNEGKTTMALSIARAYAQAGSRVLLIDCDLRRPSVHRQIGQEPDRGIMDYLTGEVGGRTLKDIVVEDQVKGLELLVGARRSDAATDQLLAGPAFETLIAAARRVFDVVILDAPPVGPVIDGVYLARLADAIVFVVRWASTPQPEIRAAITALSDVIGPDVEIVPVLNSSVISGRQYYGKYASYYSEA